MKNIYRTLTVGILSIIFLGVMTGCKDIANPEFKLTVTLQEGTSGTPEAGTYTYREFDTVDYNYESTDENVQIEVLVNGSKKTLSGTLTMYNSLDVLVRKIDIRGTWEFSYLKEDGSSEKMDITFTGDTIFGGTFSDSRGYSGTWTVSNNDLTMVFSDWVDYVFNGFISSMTGTYRGEGIDGSWSATRKN